MTSKIGRASDFEDLSVTATAQYARRSKNSRSQSLVDPELCLDIFTSLYIIVQSGPVGLVICHSFSFWMIDVRALEQPKEKKEGQ